MKLRTLLDKAAIAALCFLPFLNDEGFFSPVICFLLGTGVSELCQYFAGKKVDYILSIVFSLVCFFYSPLTLFLPLVIYDMFNQHYKTPLGICAAAMLYALPGLEAWQAVLIIVTALVAILLSYRTSSLADKELKLIQLRDSSTEANLRLSAKNKDLMDRQDYEVYVATLKERNRIAREIHDNVGHMLSRSLLQIGALSAITKNEEELEELKDVKETLNQAMNSIRSSVHDLHDDSIDIRQSVTEIMAEMRERYKVNLDIDVTPSMPSNVKLCFISTVKEAMSNIIKHSSADTITVNIHEHPAFYKLSVEDNGKCSRFSDSGMGLTNMRERTEALGGIINISGGNGFRIFISVPKRNER